MTDLIWLKLQWPILQVIIPLFGALITSICQAITYTRSIAIIAAALSFAVSSYGLITMKAATSYYLGNWKAPVGIEYKLDYLNQPILVYISCILLFTLIFCRYSIINQLERHVIPSRRHIIYTLILLVHTGLSGILATGDLFNLYVFLEIASLASYALISQGNNNEAASGALDYLILGTIGASFILIGIGMLFSVTGTLNIEDINTKLNGLYHSRIVILGLCFFITGSLLKIALFPLHIWMVRAYKVAAPAILVFIASLSSIIGFYILIRFIYFVVDYKILYHGFNFAVIIKALGLVAIMFSSYCAWKAQNIRELLSYSMAAQSGYICLMLIVPHSTMLGLIASCLLADSILKAGLFCALGSLETFPDNNENKIFQPNSEKIKRRLLLLFIFLNLISNAGMPFTIGFINKINMLSLLFNAKEYMTLTLVIASSLLALEYNYRFFRIFYHAQISINYSNLAALTLSSLSSFSLIFVNQNIIDIMSRFFAEVMSG